MLMLVVVVVVMVISTVKTLIKGFLIDACVMDESCVLLNTVFLAKTFVVTVVLSGATFALKFVIVPAIVLIALDWLATGDSLVTIKMIMMMLIAVSFTIVAEMIVVLMTVGIEDLR